MPLALPRRARLLIIGLIVVVAGSAEPLSRPARAADTPGQDASIEGALIGAKPLGEGVVNAYARAKRRFSCSRSWPSSGRSSGTRRPSR